MRAREIRVCLCSVSETVVIWDGLTCLGPIGDKLGI